MATGPGRSAMPATEGRDRSSFAEQVNRLHGDLLRGGVAVADMRRAQSLELQYAGASALGARPASRLAGIEPLEGPIEARSVPRPAPGASRLRYFLDGAQRTLPCWRVGLVPVNAVVAAAAILSRDDAGRCEIVPGTLRMRHAWLIPQQLPGHDLARLLARIRAEGGDVIDPLDEHRDDDEGYRAIAGDYGRLVELAYAAARRVRAELEDELLARWSLEGGSDDGWIVVDGRLHRAVERAVGIVKQFTDSYLGGRDAETLLGLRPGQRTTAFFPTDRYRGGPDPEARTLWYLRLWDSAGLDARHALIRVETNQNVRTTAKIDELSAWLMAERTPRATADARWATLLYPVHFLERILKRRLEADTRGWPGA